MVDVWGEGFVDDDEFLAAPNYGASDTVDDVEGDGWDPSKGFPDGCRAVRVWADDDGCLRDVRVSLGWRERLRGSSLSEAFATAFMAMNAMYHTGVHPLPRLEPLCCDDLFEGRAGWDSLRVAYREWGRVEAKMAGLGDVAPTRWVGERVSGSTFGGDVVVRLGIFGEPLGVVFDEELLGTSARVSEISRGVLRAYRKARQKYRPPHVEFGEKDLLIQEHDGISRALLDSFAGGADVWV